MGKTRLSKKFEKGQTRISDFLSVKKSIPTDKPQTGSSIAPQYVHYLLFPDKIKC